MDQADLEIFWAAWDWSEFAQHFLWSHVTHGGNRLTLCVWTFKRLCQLKFLHFCNFWNLTAFYNFNSGSVVSPFIFKYLSSLITTQWLKNIKLYATFVRPLKHVYFLWVLLKLDLKEAGPVMQQQFHYENDEAIQHVVFMQHWGFRQCVGDGRRLFFFFFLSQSSRFTSQPALFSSSWKLSQASRGDVKKCTYLDHVPEAAWGERAEQGPPTARLMQPIGWLMFRLLCRSYYLGVTRARLQQFNLNP